MQKHNSDDDVDYHLNRFDGNDVICGGLQRKVENEMKGLQRGWDLGF